MGVSAVNTLGKALWKHKWSAGINGAFGAMSFDDSMNKGEGTASAVAGAAVDIALPMVLGTVPYLALQAAEALPGLAIGAYESSAEYGRSIARSSNLTFSNAQFQDTQQLQTMREASMAAIEKSKYNEQICMLGDEAKFMHR